MLKRVFIVALVLLLVGNGAAWARPAGHNGPDKVAGTVAVSSRTETEALAPQDSTASDQDLSNSDQEATERLRATLRERIQSMQMNRDRTQESWKVLKQELQSLRHQYTIQQESRQEIKNMFKAAIRLAREQNRIQEAEQWLRELAEMDPIDASVYQELGQLFRSCGDTQPKLWCVGKQVYTEVPPVIKTGRILVPIRAVTQSLGANVEWKADQQIIVITKGDIVINLQLGKRVAIVDGKEYKLDQPPEISASRVIVPLRFVAETLKAQVNYYPEGQIVAINP
ncbi:MAG: hypothetical protein HPY90_06585 [Syntrophothermus sp.]|uniref:copper amine oxidase N-terminal domain-containing protein n=1 Tax=Syntrophothermus sp. TaxID=2736299 RepID=UPI00257B4659|nr:stalk domain-containing protein [Syntrophothermus sp.]NSW82931.1 hypothetical protein [Syntrophothermus sp.]